MQQVTRISMPLAADDPEVQRIMDVVEKFPLEGRTEIIRTVYRFVLAYSRQPDPDLLTTLVNSMVNSVQLWESESYRRATEAAAHTRRTHPVSYEEAVDVREMFTTGE